MPSIAVVKETRSVEVFSLDVVHMSSDVSMVLRGGGIASLLAVALFSVFFFRPIPPPEEIADERPDAFASRDLVPGAPTTDARTLWRAAEYVRLAEQTLEDTQVLRMASFLTREQKKTLKTSTSIERRYRDAAQSLLNGTTHVRTR